MRLPAEIAVPVEVRALDVGARVERVWRLSSAIGPAALGLERDLPFAAGRPVRVELALPGDPAPIVATGRVEVVSAAADADAGDADAERPPVTLVTFTDIAPETRARVARYVEERSPAP